MLTWLKMLPIELDSVVEYLDPGTPIGYKEKVIGPVSEDLKKLYTLWKLKDKEADQEAINVKFAKSSEERLESSILLNKNTEIASCLQRLFWIALKDELDLWSINSNVGIRQGYIVVTTENDSMQELWGMFFGKP